MEKVILNGELYIKKLPKIESKYFVSENVIPELLDENENVIEDFDFTNPEHLKCLPPSLIAAFENLGVLKKIERKNYEDNYSFYQIVLDQKGFYLVNKKLKTSYHFNTLEELEKEFISLIDFIHEALYIGRYLEPIDMPLSKVELLYEYNGVYLLKELASNEYIVISKNHPLLSHFKMTDIISYYYEKTELLKDIIIQELKPQERRR